MIKLSSAELILVGSLWGTFTLLASCQTPASDTSMPMESENERLTTLFQQLATAQSRAELELIQADIWREWLTISEPVAEQWMAQGISAMADRDYDEAIRFFTQIIEAEPAYPEGWNKRATAYYLRGDYKASIDDIQETLAREERHFGALSGLATIYQTLGDQRGALKTLEKLATLMPADEGIQNQIKQLRSELGIRNI